MPVVLVVAACGVRRRVAAEPVFRALGRRLAADFLVAVRGVTEADFRPTAERFALLRLLAAPLAAAFFLGGRRLGFSGSPVRASTKAVTALFATSTARSHLLSRRRLWPPARRASECLLSPCHYPLHAINGGWEQYWREQ